MTPEQNVIAPEYEIIASTDSERQSSAWDIRNAPKNYISLVIYQIGSAILSFASVWLITHYLGSDGYGSIVAVLAGSQVVQFFVNWTCVALARYGVEEFVETGAITKSFWARTVIFLPNTIFLLASNFLWLPLLAWWLKLPTEALWYLAIHFGVMAVWLHIQHAIQGAKLPRLQGVLQALERSLIFTVLVALAYFGRLDYLSGIAAYIAGPLVMSIIGLFYIRKLFSWRITIDRD